MAIIDDVRKWLMRCPSIAESGDYTTAFRINYLSEEGIEFAIEDSPSEGIERRYLRGAGNLCVKEFIISSRQLYSPVTAAQAMVSGIFDDLMAWVAERNDNRDFPDIGYQVASVETSTTGFILQVTADTCRVQMALRVRYYRY